MQLARYLGDFTSIDRYSTSSSVSGKVFVASNPRKLFKF